jgi:hypothetical protein
MADELNVDRTPGFKVGEKKTIDEYQKLGKPNSNFKVPNLLYGIIVWWECGRESLNTSKS